MSLKHTDTLLNPSKLVELLDSEVSLSTLAKWRTIGRGPRYIKIGRSVVYRESDVQQWLDRQTRTHTSQTEAAAAR